MESPSHSVKTQTIELAAVPLEPRSEPLVVIGLRRPRRQVDAKDLCAHVGVLECPVQIGADDTIDSKAVGFPVVECRERGRRQSTFHRCHTDVDFVGAERHTTGGTAFIGTR